MRGRFDLVAVALNVPLAAALWCSWPAIAGAQGAADPPAGSTEAPLTLTNSIGMKFVLIPAGRFQMGSPASEEKRGTDEQQHLVRITHSYYMGIYEVTQAEYQLVMGTNPSCFSASGDAKEVVERNKLNSDKLPVEMVTWYQCVKFCEILSKFEGRNYRLPTEADWEYACRAGTTSPFSFGASSDGSEANCNGNFPYGTTTEGPYLERTATVVSYEPNAFGLYDMHGNVWEWCSDWHDPKYYSTSPLADPRGPSSGSNRVGRGGGWDDNPAISRSADRSGLDPSFRFSDLGFRVVRER